ncbi:hypothetical protein [Alloalcanivorax dieselolei]|uniref:hypothetical protein n=1 Tax=Alloalcanivorax dieselolei TaxID=285091 RepID=UPI001427DD5D|nr:hypothetical protein [Alloalcanivorax dieselolei]
MGNFENWIQENCGADFNDVHVRNLFGDYPISIAAVGGFVGEIKILLDIGFGVALFSA